MIITYSDARAVIRIINNTRMRNAELPIIVRTTDDSHLEELEAAGATRVVPERLESSMMLATHMLEVLDFPASEIIDIIDRTREDHYHQLRGYFHGIEAESVADLADDHYRHHTVVLSPGCRAIGKTLAEINLDKLDVQVMALRRGNIRGDTPDPSLQLKQGDALLLEGSNEELELAEEVLFKGT
jgi:CPA2 family monovalent cation:H+ antiporter-2